MKIVETYSHLNGLEYINYHKKLLWEEIQDVIKSIDASQYKTKVSNEVRTPGALLYNPTEMNRGFKLLLNNKGWQERRDKYWVTENVQLIRETLTLSEDKQKEHIIAAKKNPMPSYNQTDFVKDRVAIEIQFGKYSFVAYDLFVKHVAFFTRNAIDLGIEILPMKSMQQEMSSGVAYYEGELYNVVRQGRSAPAVPLIMIGIAP